MIRSRTSDIYSWSCNHAIPAIGASYLNETRHDLEAFPCHKAQLPSWSQLEQEQRGVKVRFHVKHQTPVSPIQTKSKLFHLTDDEEDSFTAWFEFPMSLVKVEAETDAVSVLTNDSYMELLDDLDHIEQINADDEASWLCSTPQYPNATDDRQLVGFLVDLCSKPVESRDSPNDKDDFMLD